MTYSPAVDARGNFYLSAVEDTLSHKKTVRYKWNGREYARQNNSAPKANDHV